MTAFKNRQSEEPRTFLPTGASHIVATLCARYAICLINIDAQLKRRRDDVFNAPRREAVVAAPEEEDEEDGAGRASE